MTSIASVWSGDKNPIFSLFAVEPQEWCEVSWDRTVINTIYCSVGTMGG